MAGSRTPAADRSTGRDWVYAGFWIRVWASLIDTVLLAIVLWPLITWLVPDSTVSTTRIFASDGQINLQALAVNSSLLPSGPIDGLVNWLLPALVVILFWIYREATPGKMLIGARIVDATTGEPARKRQLVGRYLGYYVSTLVFLLGFFWVGIDRRKQGWHDKLAHTVVVRRPSTTRPADDFDRKSPPSNDGPE